MKNTVVLFAFICLKMCTLHAQSLYVYQTNTAKNSYPLKEIKEITFVNREMYIIPPITDTALVRIPLADLRILSFTDYDGVSIAGVNGYSPELRIYPNPTKGQLTIACRDVINHVSTVEIFNVVGQRLFTTPNPSETSAPLSFQGGEYSPFEGGRGMSGKASSLLERAGGEAIIDISHLPIGMYFIKINTDKGIITRKIVKINP